MAPTNHTIICSFITILALAVCQSIPSSGEGTEAPPFCFEKCLRRAFNMSPPCPPPTPSSGAVISPSVLCKDKERAYHFSVSINGKLPPRYLLALCRVLKDQGKIEAYIKETFPGHTVEHLMDGQSCGKLTAGKPDHCSSA